jgi:uncharacterized protein
MRTAPTSPPDRAASPPTAVPDADVPADQLGLGRAALLHLFPGVALTLFIVLAAPVVESFGFPVVFALFAGIGLVIVPLELGYLLLHARRTTGTWSLHATVGYRRRTSRRQLLRWVPALVGWFTLWLAISTVLIDRWLAEAFFSWMPDAILQFSRVDEAGEPVTTAVLVTLVVTMVVLNGFVGPIVEELYFRGHILPRLRRLGRLAPLVNTVLFLLYHLWTPWQVPARVIGFLPTTWLTWRERSLQISIVAHVAMNLLFLAGFAAAFLATA